MIQPHRKYHEDEDEAMEEVILPGEIVTTDTQFMRGHGTYAADTTIHSSVLGSISRVNKLLSVNAFKSRYSPEIGDLVVGIITDLAQKKWKVDINSRVDATLQLASINLPGGIQRRKTGSDELQMRSFFQEGDLIVAEVQSLYHDGSVSLHTRSLKYGKLRNGQFVKVSTLRSKQSSIQIGDVDVILGVNGYAFVSMHTTNSLSENVHNNLSEAASLSIYSDENAEIPHHVVEQITKIRNLLVAFHKEGIRMDVHMVKRAAEEAFPYSPNDLLDSTTYLPIIHAAR